MAQNLENRNHDSGRVRRRHSNVHRRASSMAP
jgi:hypothetical protein